MWQPLGSTVIEREQLVVPFALSMCRHIERNCGDFARLTECRRMESGVELVSFELDVERPQRPVYAILPTESITVCFWPDNTVAPLIAVARPDFPDTPHQSLVFEGMPSFICVDDRPWQDIRGGYTASELLARISFWFAKAGQGELHGADQPFEPVFSTIGPYEIILQKDAEEAIASGQKLDVWVTDERARFLVVTSTPLDGRLRASGLNLHVAYVAVRAEKMKRMRRAPGNLKELGTFLAEREVCLKTILKDSVSDWMTKGKGDKDTKWVFCVLVSMPQIHPSSGVIGRTSPMAFICETSPGRIGQAMGLLTRNDSDEAGGINYLPMLFAESTMDELDQFPLLISNVHREFDSELAAAMAAGTPETRRILMIGAGSLGSTLAEILSRQGLFRWTVVDDDDLLPHNLARHVLTGDDLGAGKASRVASRIQSVRADAAATSIRANVLAAEQDPALSKALEEADIVLDASASVPVSRWLSDRKGSARSICAFFTPDGRSAVLMIEPSDKSADLRSMEAAYLREVLTNPALKDHFRPGQEMRYTGACRALTNRIPTSSVVFLAGLIASGIAAGIGSDDATLTIWSMNGSGGIDCILCHVANIRNSVGEWTVSLPCSLHADLRARRTSALPRETGGALVGIIDYDGRRIELVDALAPPPDSIGKPESFTRGTRRLRRQIEEAAARSGSQVRYIGEWHSHPAGVSASPSSTDIVQIGELSLILRMDDLPAISVIVGTDDIGIMVGEVV